MLYIIIAVAVVAFLICLCFIFWDNVKSFIKKKFSKKSKGKKPVGEPLKQDKPSPINIEEFIPLKNQFDDSVRDSSLEELLAKEDDFISESELFPVEQKPSRPTLKQEIKSNSFDNMFSGRIKSSSKSTKKSIAKQIRNLSPELKTMLIDSVLKKRDDV